MQSDLRTFYITHAVNEFFLLISFIPKYLHEFNRNSGIMHAITFFF
jgi:hypothetical protein